MSNAGWRSCIDHIIRPDSPCPVCEIERLSTEVSVKDKLLAAWLESDCYDDADLKKLRGMTLRGEWDTDSGNQDDSRQCTECEVKLKARRTDQ